MFKVRNKNGNSRLRYSGVVLHEKGVLEWAVASYISICRTRGKSTSSTDHRPDGLEGSALEGSTGPRGRCCHVDTTVGGFVAAAGSLRAMEVWPEGVDSRAKTCKVQQMMRTVFARKEHFKSMASYCLHVERILGVWHPIARTWSKQSGSVGLGQSGSGSVRVCGSGSVQVRVSPGLWVWISPRLWVLVSRGLDQSGSVGLDQFGSVGQLGSRSFWVCGSAQVPGLWFWL